MTIENYLSKAAPATDWQQSPVQIAAIVESGQDGQIIGCLYDCPLSGGGSYWRWKDRVLSPDARQEIAYLAKIGKIVQVGEPTWPPLDG